VGKLENWLKGNFVESGEKMFEFIGYLNTLRLLIEKVRTINSKEIQINEFFYKKSLEACRKSFYFYCQYLDQGLFLPLALVATGSVSSLHNELMQWNKYSRILHDCQVEKVKKEFGMGRVEAWCKENHLVEVLGLVKKETCELKNHPNGKNTQPKNQKIPPKLKQNLPTPSQPSSSQSKTKFVKKSKSSLKGDEIDDIFNLF